MKQVVFVSCAVFLFSTRAAGDCWFALSPEGVEVVPPVPTSSDEVRITLKGQWPDSCVPMGMDVDTFVQQKEILAQVFSGRQAGQACLAVITPWSRTVTIRPLLPGTWDLFGLLVGEGLCSPERKLLTRITVTDLQFLLSHDSLEVGEGGEAQFEVSLRRPAGPVEATVEVQAGAGGVRIDSGSRLAFDDSSSSTPQTVRLSAAEDADLEDSQATIRIAAPGFATVELPVLVVDDDRPSALRVDARAAGRGDGRDWENAFSDLTAALEFAARYPASIRRVLVAGGVYRPAGPDGDRNRSFRLAGGVALEGGYAGTGAPDPDARDVRRHQTVLSGDLNGDDGPDFQDRNDNSHSVVDGRGVSPSTVLDGFTIAGGDGGIQGGGINLMEPQSDLTVRNCTISRNRASFGAGVRTFDSSPTFLNCVFAGNEATFGSNNQGGGMWTGCRGRASIINCTFIGNAVREEGGGLWSCSPETLVINSIFWGNRGGSGEDEVGQVAGGGGGFSRSCIQGWTGKLGGEGNFGIDPLLIGAAAGDPHLSPGSPCIDTGHGGVVDLLGDRDIDGEPRVSGGGVDIGADESGSRRLAFRRGDANADGRVNIADPVLALAYLFLERLTPPCLDALDSNDDARINVADPISMLEHLFLGGGPLPAPYPGCGLDPSGEPLGPCHDAGCP